MANILERKEHLLDIHIPVVEDEYLGVISVGDLGFEINPNLISWLEQEKENREKVATFLLHIADGLMKQD